ncbi:hypothetical protein J7K99_04320 [bacterium]|nr:hypothetical protein [bacterium]
MKYLTLKQLAQKVLEEERRPLTPQEIWEIAVQKGYDKLTRAKSKKPWGPLNAELYQDIKDNPDTPFVKIDSKPKKFFLKYLVSEGELRKIESKGAGEVAPLKKTKYKERELHPFLAYFAHTFMGAYTKTILHEKSGRRKYTQWLHPDMVGVHFPIEEWETEVIDFARETGSPAVTLYSFEIKKELGFSNLRESFFQTVSNSSWANEGYLVAADIEQDPEFRAELKRLSDAFGIGIIKLDITDPDSSEIIFPARHKNQIDWDTLNKLARENPNAREFLRRITVDLATKEIRREKYDKVPDYEKLLELGRKMTD